MPVQKCIAGEDISNLSDVELLAVIIGTGGKNSDVMELSSALIKKHNGLRGIRNSGIREIAVNSGIGLKKAVKIKTAFELGKRVLGSIDANYTLSSPEAVWRYLLPEVAGLTREQFRVLVMNNKNILIKKSVVSIGTISEAIVHPREVFKEAIRESGSSIIVAHNHPSGEVNPSKEDISTTKRLSEAGRLIGIPLLDHVIVCDSSYYSMKENGYLE
jgi:DNA repair protein RadC